MREKPLSGGVKAVFWGAGFLLIYLAAQISLVPAHRQQDEREAQRRAIAASHEAAAAPWRLSRDNTLIEEHLAPGQTSHTISVADARIWWTDIDHSLGYDYLVNGAHKIPREPNKVTRFSDYLPAGKRVTSLAFTARDTPIDVRVLGVFDLHEEQVAPDSGSFALRLSPAELLKLDLRDAYSHGPCFRSISLVVEQGCATVRTEDLSKGLNVCRTTSLELFDFFALPSRKRLERTTFLVHSREPSTAMTLGVRIQEGSGNGKQCRDR